MLTSVIVLLGALFMTTGIGADEGPLIEPIKFAADFYTAVRDENPTENVILSPLSVQTALALILMGADGNTKEQIVRGLHLRTNNQSAIADHFGDVLARYTTSGVLKMANKVYTRTGYSVHPELHQMAKKDFKLGVESVNFAERSEAARTINSWVEERTENRIKDLFKADDLDPATRMVLVNVIHFKAAWSDPFDERSTRKANFWVSETESVEVDMMWTITPIMYGVIPELDAKVGFLPYKNTDLRMMILLPNSRTGLADLENKLKTFDFSKLRSVVHERWTEINLPKFQIETTVDLKTVLTKLGMTDMFSNLADFPRLIDSAERLKIDKAVHKTFIKVDERGTEAAAATGLGFAPMSIPPVLNVDHPFFFAIATPNDVAFLGSVRHF